MPPLTLASDRFAIALLVLSPLLACSGRCPILNRPAAFLGFAAIFVVYGSQNLGLRYTGGRAPGVTAQTTAVPAD